MQNRANKRPVIYLDEMWPNSHDGKDLAWVEDDLVTGGTVGGVRCPPGKGTRLIILGAGGKDGLDSQYNSHLSLPRKTQVTTMMR